MATRLPAACGAAQGTGGAVGTVGLGGAGATGGFGGTANAGTTPLNPGADGKSQGGGIYNKSTLTLDHTTATDNTPDDLFTDPAGKTTLKHATIGVINP